MYYLPLGAIGWPSSTILAYFLSSCCSCRAGLSGLAHPRLCRYCCLWKLPHFEPEACGPLVQSFHCGVGKQLVVERLSRAVLLPELFLGPASAYDAPDQLLSFLGCLLSSFLLVMLSVIPLLRFFGSDSTVCLPSALETDTPLLPCLTNSS